MTERYAVREMDYLDTNFGAVENGEFHIDGYVYYVGEPYDKPYRAVQFCGCYIPLDKRGDSDYVNNVEAECKQYIEDISEEKAKEYIDWYLEHLEQL